MNDVSRVQRLHCHGQVDRQPMQHDLLEALLRLRSQEVQQIAAFAILHHGVHEVVCEVRIFDVDQI